MQSTMKAIDSTLEKNLVVEEQEVSSPSIDTAKSPTDSLSPRLWPRWKKLLTASIICFYTFVVYIGSTMCMAMYPSLMIRFGITEEKATLAMATYVFGYGSGAMIFSPLSEIPSVGRNIPYITTSVAFVLLSLATALVDTWPLFLACRFLQGFAGSPALATGGASMQDIYGPSKLPFAFIAWIGVATLGPALGPAISWYTVVAKGWKSPMWEMFGLSILSLLLIAFVLPETLEAKLTHKREGKSSLISSSSKMTTKAVVSYLADVFNKPLVIMVTNPAIFFSNFYTCLIYAIYYSFFESIPRTFLVTYHFTLSGLSLVALSIAVGAALGTVLYFPWTVWWSRRFDSMRSYRKAEQSLLPAVYSSVLVPVGLFIFAFTARSDIHWCIPMMGMVLETAGVFIVLQCLANYLLLAYPVDAASLLAGNDLMRSSLAAAAILFSGPMKKRNSRIIRSPAATVTTSTEAENGVDQESQRLTVGSPAQTSIPDQQTQSHEDTIRMIPTPSWHSGSSSNIPVSREQYNGPHSSISGREQYNGPPPNMPGREQYNDGSQPSPVQHLTMTPQEEQLTGNPQGPATGDSTYIGRAHYLENNIDESTARSYTASRADGLSPTELATLQIWNSFDLPPRSVSQSLIEAFREYCFPWMPTVEAGELHLSRNQPPSYLLMQSVFLAASRVSPSPGLAEYATSEQLYQRARALFWVAHEKDPLTVVKSITMLHWYNPDGPAHVSYDTSEYWLKIGVGLAYQIGLHKEPTPSPQRAMRRRIWWSLVVRDAMISVSRGRPRAINLEDSDTGPPSMEDFADMPEDGELFLPYVGICCLLGDLVETCSRKRVVESLKRLQSENILFRWIRTLPERLRLSELSSDGSYTLRPHNLRSRQLHVPYFICASILAISENPTKTVAAAGILSASFVAGIFEDFLARDQIKHLQPIFTTYCFVSGLLLLSTRPWPDLWTAAQSDLGVLQKCLLELSKRWKSAIGASKALRKALDSPARSMLQHQQTMFPLTSEQYSLFEGFATDLCRMWAPYHSASMTPLQDWGMNEQTLENAAMRSVDMMSTTTPQLGHMTSSTDDYFLNPEYEGLTNWFLSDWSTNGLG
ncbi:hypothetical protein MBLNU457_7558t1 [Dothideomycetes sp. NU457]